MALLSKLVEVELKIIHLGPKFLIQVIALLILITGTALIAQQRVQQRNDEPNQSIVQASSDVVDSVQNERISELRTRMDKADDRLTILQDQQGATQRAVDRIVGLGIGFGSALTILQALNVLLQWRTGVRQPRVP